jgi:hypothetical protein
MADKEKLISLVCKRWLWNLKSKKNTTSGISQKKFYSEIALETENMSNIITSIEELLNYHHWQW